MKNNKQDLFYKLTNKSIELESGLNNKLVPYRIYKFQNKLFKLQLVDLTKEEIERNKKHLEVEKCKN